LYPNQKALAMSTWKALQMIDQTPKPEKQTNFRGAFGKKLGPLETRDELRMYTNLAGGEKFVDNRSHHGALHDCNCPT